MNEHLALKGGTAINMTIFNLPRLSVDLDLDFTPNLLLEDMKKAREKIEEMLERYMTEEEGLTNERVFYHFFALLLKGDRNFSYMPEIRWKYGYPAVILASVVIAAVLIWKFKKKRWL